MDQSRLPQALGQRRIVGRWPLICALALAAACRMPPEPPPGVPLVLMTYNIHHGEGTDGVFDLERLAAVIRTQNPDLVALQEVDVHTGRAGGVDQASELGRLTGMHVAFAEAMPFDGGSYGDAVLSRLPIDQFLDLHLDASSGHEPRSAAAVTVTLADGRQLRFASTHLDHTDDPTDRIRQAKQLRDLLGPEDPGRATETGDRLPTVIAGDLNATQKSKPILTLATDWFASDDRRQSTFPSDGPNRKIDWIMLPRNSRWLVNEVYVIEDPVATDHCGLVVHAYWQ